MDFAEARQRMVDSQVRANDVTNQELQKAMETTPRETFLPPEFREQAYAERDIEYAPGRWLLRARDFSKLVAIADPRFDDLVLNALCGSGYSTAILAQLAEMVVSTESDEALAARAEENLNTIGLSNAAVLVAEPAAGAKKQGPFDLIFVGAVIEDAPQELLAQLKDGGRLAAIRREGGVSRGVLIRRDGDIFCQTEHFDAASERVAPGFEAPKAFVF